MVRLAPENSTAQRTAIDLAEVHGGASVVAIARSAEDFLPASAAFARPLFSWTGDAESRKH